MEFPLPKTLQLIQYFVLSQYIILKILELLTTTTMLNGCARRGHHLALLSSMNMVGHIALQLRRQRRAWIRGTVLFCKGNELLNSVPQRSWCSTVHPVGDISVCLCARLYTYGHSILHLSLFRYHHNMDWEGKSSCSPTRPNTVVATLLWTGSELVWRQRRASQLTV